ncbi:methyltransferase domain-containing protein [Belnapia sp. T18]|uniref:Methyltransferase domain-containing protein n=1 Tax=Belnapia arida TaxID=2804533 RepID=A0ABS1U5T3_9PROT|nr:class I SAM-dependent methyltransferase [Belnapia arida]MBL6079072.1 methyltransferase domain-containing protein [Belnapia arida]
MDADRNFRGSVPALYDRYLGPMIFAPYAEDMAARLAGLAEGHLLETAAGTGIVTRALDAVLPPGVGIVATDLNQPMLDHAAGQAASARVSWRQADAQALPFPDGMFDAVVCQFGVMFFPDKARAFAEAHRVLKPGGRLLFSVWDRIEANDFADAVVKAVAGLFPDDPPMFLVRTPHGHHELAPLCALLREVGFGAVEEEAVERESRAAEARAVAIGFCQGTPMRGEIEAQGDGALTAATEAAAKAVAARFGEGPVVGRIKAKVVTAVR